MQGDACMWRQSYPHNPLDSRLRVNDGVELERLTGPTTYKTILDRSRIHASRMRFIGVVSSKAKNLKLETDLRATISDSSLCSE